eukprot:124594-Chlamydomonas_euryale.AAC.1
MPRDARLVWTHMHRQTRDAAPSKYDDLTPTASQTAAYIAFPRLVAAWDALLAARRKILPPPHWLEEYS